jgi:hypothetical protein
MQPLWMQNATLAQLAQECTVGLVLKPSAAICNDLCRISGCNKRRPKLKVTNIIRYEEDIKEKAAKGLAVAQRTETALLYAQEKLLTILLCEQCHLTVHANFNEALIQ